MFYYLKGFIKLIFRKESKNMNSVLFSSVEGNGQCLDGGAMFGHVPRALWSQWYKPSQEGRILLSCRALLIEMKGLKILCETGIGAFFEPHLAERYGVQNPKEHKLLSHLNSLGIKEEEIDYVILSHLHFDHAGGLLPTYKEQQEGKTGLCFPGARYVVGERAFERACEPHVRDKASFIPGLPQKLKESGRLILIEGDKIPGVLEEQLSFVFTEGHTPGEMHVLWTSEEGDKIFFAGDLIPGRHWVHLPITMGYDRWPEKLIEEKQQIYEKAVAENWWIFFTHDPSVACAQIQKNSKGHYETYDEKKALTQTELRV